MTPTHTHTQRRMPGHVHPAQGILALCLTPLLTACLNEANTLVGAGPVPLPALAPADTAAPAPTPVATHTTTLDRSHWPAQVLQQPRHQVAWSFFGTAHPEWAVAHGPGTLPPNAPPTFTP